MIVVTGSVLTNAVNRTTIEALSIKHCQRSRAEPGCIAHNVHADCENPDRLVFLEVWADAAAVQTHFAVPASGAFVREIGGLSSEPPEMKLYSVDEIPVSALRK
jgi:quinol monooxygenase YgiN